MRILLFVLASTAAFAVMNPAAAQYTAYPAGPYGWGLLLRLLRLLTGENSGLTMVGAPMPDSSHSDRSNRSNYPPITRRQALA